LHHQPVEMMVDEATALIYEHNLPEGVALLRQAVQTDPSSATAQYNLAKVLCMTGQTTEGIARYRKALRLRPGYAEAHNNLGIALARQGQNSDALIWRSSRRLSPTLRLHDKFTCQKIRRASVPYRT
jgi:Tfp pilus assembly protein PilF